MTDDGVATADETGASGADAGGAGAGGAGADASTTGADADDDSRSYGGVLTAFPYAVRASDSRTFKLYGTGAALLSLVLAFYFAAAVAVVVSNTLGGASGTFSFVRSFYVFVGFAVVAPIVGPVLFVAREHRRGRGDRRYDRRMAALGVVYVLALYVAVVISMPAAFTLDGETVTRPAPSGAFAPVVRVLYAMPQASSVLPPAVVALAMYLLDRRHDGAANGA